jgi:hypothetical protein
MAKQYHYVVYWDDEDKKFHVSSEETVAAFPDGNVYETSAERWNDAWEVDEEAAKTDLETQDILEKILNGG